MAKPLTLAIVEGQHAGVPATAKEYEIGGIQSGTQMRRVRGRIDVRASSQATDQVKTGDFDMNHDLQTLITVTASLFLGSIAGYAQTRKPALAEKTSAWVQGHTPDGQPDLQGTWTNASNVPFEGPRNSGRRSFLPSRRGPNMRSAPSMDL
jgi:hypothetical protein